MGHASARAAPGYQRARSDKPVAEALRKILDAVSDTASGADEAEDCGAFVAREGLRIVE
jgi:hypothetical protein